MCRKKDADSPKTGCQKPENLKTTPQECSPEQIKKCHGDVKEHPCVKGARGK